MSKPLSRALLEQTSRRWLPADAKTQITAAPVKPIPAAKPSASTIPSLSMPLQMDATHAKVLDPEVVRDLLDVMGDEFTDLVHVYLEDTPKALAALDLAAAHGNVEGLIAPSHSLKSTSANLGALGLSELAKRLEHGARSGTLNNDAPALVAEINRTFQIVSTELNALLANSTA